MICPNCQHENPDAARFCHNCGTALDAPRPPEGERRRVTVLFADVVGSTGMAERLDPEEMVELMNGAFEFMTRAVVRYGGTVARLMGDSVLAFFGAPAAHEDDAERAVRAALDIREEARAYASRAEARYGVPFDVRVGIDTGLVVAGAVGSALGTEYTAMGDTPNVAARLQAAAEPGTVLVSDATLRLVRHVVDVEPRGPLAVRGRSRPVETFAVRRAKAITLTARGLEGLHSPMVGRDAERRQLGRLLEALASGEGAFLKVAGEAGIGKSRLLAEARETAPLGRLHWLEGRALSYAQTVAFFPWRQLLGHAIGATDADEPAAVRERLAAAATRWRTPPDDLPFLQAILAADDGGDPLAGLERDEAAARLATAVCRVLTAISADRPTVAVLDDLHWADPNSLDLLARLAPATRALPLLLVCLARPDGGPASRRTLLQVRNELGDAFHEITLAPLDPPRTRELLGNLLPDEGLPEATRAAILQRVEGNPFFLEEVIRALIDCGHLVRDGDGWRADAASGEVAIPETLAGVLSARIDRLPEPAKRVAQTAAVLGRIFAHEVLTDVCQQAPPPERIENVGPHLATLAYEELVRERARQPVLEYIFKHALTQETAYDLLLMRRRRELHRRAGEALERFHRQRGDDAAAILARHFRLGEDWPRAAAYARRAGTRARKLFALEDALVHFEQALETLDRLASPPPEDVIDATVEWVGVATTLRLHEQPAERERLLARLERTLAVARDLGDDRRTARVLVDFGNVLTLSGRPATAFPLLLEASDLAAALGDDHLFLLPFFATTEQLVDQDPRQAVDRMREVIALAQTHRDRGIEAHATAVLASAHARLGEADEARRTIARALELGPASGSIIKEADVHIVAATVFYDLGEVALGIEHGTRGARLAHSVNGIECACAGYALTGLGNLHAERPGVAIDDFATALQLGGDTDMALLLNQIQAWKAIAHFHEGDPDALARIRTTLEHARRLGDDFGAAFIGRSLADLLIRAGDLESARPLLDDALAYYRQRGLRPYVARTLESLAEMHEREGRADDAAADRRLALDALTAPLALLASNQPHAHGEAGDPSR